MIFVPQGEFVAFYGIDAGAGVEQTNCRHGVAAAGAGLTAAAAEVLTWAAICAACCARWLARRCPVWSLQRLVWGVHAMQAGLCCRCWQRCWRSLRWGRPVSARLSASGDGAGADAPDRVGRRALCADRVGPAVLGAEGARTSAFTKDVQPRRHQHLRQSLLVYAFTAVLVVVMGLFFKYTHCSAKALRATAANRTGARLVGVSPNFAGSLSITLAAAIGAMSGLLIAPITTVYYDTGFLVGLKGFVGAIVGGLASYPIAAAARSLSALSSRFLVLGQRLQGSDRLHADPADPVVALADHPSPRGGMR